jgi:intraflagellar transport protein 46
MSYTYKMPDLEELMQTWPYEMEEALSSLPLPSAELDLSLEEYARVICALFDIPVKGNLVESLHVLFTLFQMTKDLGFAPGGSRAETPNL